MKNRTKSSQEARTVAQFFQSVIRQAKFWVLVLIPIVAGALVLFQSIGSSQPQERIEVSLDTKSSIFPVQQIGVGTYRQPEDNTMRVAIAGVLSPTKTLEYYQELLTYMEQKLADR